jgi:hypothetical protein
LHTSGLLIKDLTLLGEFLRQFPEQGRKGSDSIASLNETCYDPFLAMLEKEHLFNPWFTREWVDRALAGVARMLEERTLQQWLGAYETEQMDQGSEKTVGLVLAGNIPLVGFHDILCVLVAGHRVLAKPSSKDDRLIRKVAEVLRQIDPVLGSRIAFTDEPLKGLDAVIATGSDNSARYFEHYFRGIPHIIRKNRNGVAVLTGGETERELEALGGDIFTYFGMGCRNVSKIYVPVEYDLRILLGVLDRFHRLGQHHKYSNNVDYYRSIYLMIRVDFLDNGVLLLKEDSAIASPVGVVYYERYSDIGGVRQSLKELGGKIQCIVSIHPDIPGRIAPGTTQEPMPWDYADGVDTLRFLTEQQ